MFLQVCFTPNGMDMRMLQPCSAPLRRHFLPGVKVEYSISSRQRAYRVQIHRIQVREVKLKDNNINIITHESYYTFYPSTDPESVARRHLSLRFLPHKTSAIHHHGFRSVNLYFRIICSFYPVIQSVIWFYIYFSTEPKPLTDISIVTRTAGHSDISRIK